MGKQKCSHCKLYKLKRYTKEDRPARMRSYVTKHKIDLPTVELSKRRNLLHYCSKYGLGGVCRYLLETGVNPYSTDEDGNTPLHLGLRRALKETSSNVHTIYNEVILPQLEKCPFLTEEVDDFGTSCRDLLDRLLEKQQRQKSSGQEFQTWFEAPETVDCSSPSEHEWQQKIFQEYHYECEQEGGKIKVSEYFEGDFNEETYDEWCERMAREVHNKRKYSNTGQKSKEESKNKKTTAEDDLEKAREKMKQKYEDEQRRIKELRIRQKKQNYEDNIRTLLSSKDVEPIGYSDIPWPFETEVTDISKQLFCDISTADKETYRKYLREQQIRWHPDKFLQKLGHRIKEEEKDCILERVKEISQELNKLFDSS